MVLLLNKEDIKGLFFIQIKGKHHFLDKVKSALYLFLNYNFSEVKMVIIRLLDHKSISKLNFYPIDFQEC